MHRTLYSANDDTILALIEHGADANVNATNVDGSTALHVALLKKCFESLPLVLSHGVNVNIQNTVSTVTFLDAWNGCEKLLNRLWHTNFSALEINEHMKYRFLIQSTHSYMVEHVEEQKELINIETPNGGMTAPDMAVFLKYDEIVQLITPLTHKC